MISTEKLRDIAKLKGLHIGYAEKDYLLDLLLFIISRDTKDELVFKGGTCLSKMYGLDRFSENLDFTMSKRCDIELLLSKIERSLKLFGVEVFSLNKKESKASVLIKLRLKGPLYAGTPQSTNTIRIDINCVSSLDAEPKVERYSSIYGNIPAMTLCIMPLEELLAEKIRALIIRQKARDLYDLAYFLKKGAKLDRGMVRSKLEYYGMKPDMSDIKDAIESKRLLWPKEMRPLIDTLYDFDDVKDTVISAMAKSMKSRPYC